MRKKVGDLKKKRLSCFIWINLVLHSNLTTINYRFRDLPLKLTVFNSHWTVK